MPCPQCGGQTRQPLAPGFWRCESLITVTENRLVPDPGMHPALGLLVPMPFSYQVECNHHYQEATSEIGAGMTESCALCTLFAVGHCAECLRPICGRPAHSGFRGDRLLCRDHYLEVDRLARLRADEEAERERMRRETKKTEDEETERAKQARHEAKLDEKRAVWGPEGAIRNKITQIDRKLSKYPSADRRRFPWFRWIAISTILAAIGVSVLWDTTAPLGGQSIPRLLIIPSLLFVGVLTFAILDSKAMEATILKLYRQREMLSKRVGCGDAKCQRCLLPSPPERRKGRSG